jgi:mannose-6-phosphate isomerase-like protein (cupin superfamily)
LELVKKPWGHEKVFTFNEISTVKILTVKPNQKLSLQYHYKREEMWYFLTEGYMVLGEKEMKVKKGELIKIKKEVPHRLFSKDKEIQVMEISLGTFEWEDIVRIEDSYKREGTTKR